MAIIYGKNYEGEYVAVPQVKGAVGENGGRVRALYDSFAGAAAAGDSFYIGKIPAGARILRITASGMGTSPSFNVAVNDKLAAETVVIGTMGATPAASGYAFIEYILD